MDLTASHVDGGIELHGGQDSWLARYNTDRYYSLSVWFTGVLEYFSSDTSPKHGLQL